MFSFQNIARFSFGCWQKRFTLFSPIRKVKFHPIVDVLQILIVSIRRNDFSRAFNFYSGEQLFSVNPTRVMPVRARHVEWIPDDQYVFRVRNSRLDAGWQQDRILSYHFTDGKRPNRGRTVSPIHCNWDNFLKKRSPYGKKKNVYVNHCNDK